MKNPPDASVPPESSTSLAAGAGDPERELGRLPAVALVAGGEAGVSISREHDEFGPRGSDINRNFWSFTTGFEGEIAWLEIDDNVQIRVARQAIQRKVDTAKGETAVPTVNDVNNAKGKIEPAPGTEVDD